MPASNWENCKFLHDTASLLKCLLLASHHTNSSQLYVSFFEIYQQSFNFFICDIAKIGKSDALLQMSSSKIPQGTEPSVAFIFRHRSTEKVNGYFLLEIRKAFFRLSIIFSCDSWQASIGLGFFYSFNVQNRYKFLKGRIFFTKST